MVMPDQPRRGQSPSTEAWARQFSHIPSSYGRLVYLAALRDPDTGQYEHYGTDDRSRVTVNRCLGELHERVFREWIALSLEKKMADVELYLSGINRVDREEIIDAWLRLTPYKNLVPASIQGPERQRHVSDFEAILGLLKNVYGVASPDPSA